MRMKFFEKRGVALVALALAIAHVFDGKLSFYPEEG